MYHRRMTAKVPWLPSLLPPGARPERCPRCGKAAFIAWTLRRDDQTKAVMRTWVCTECQLTQERPEPE
jgi:ribosomal protein S27AE